MPNEENLNTPAGSPAPPAAPDNAAPPVDNSTAAGQSPAPAPAGEQTPAAPAPEKSNREQIDDYNRRLAEEIEQEEAGDEEIAGEEKAGSEDIEGDAAGSSAQTNDASPAITFDAENETADTYAEKKKQIEEGWELPAPVTAQISYLESELAKAREAGLADLPLPKETVVAVANAFDQMYDSVDDGNGGLTPNVEPAVSMLREKYARQFPEFAKAVLGTDSSKYKGASLMEEFMVDTFGAEKAEAMLAYGHSTVPLPTVPTAAKLPDGVSKELTEAYAKWPEIKRFELEGLTKELKEKEAELETAADYYKDDIRTAIGTLKEKINAEVQSLVDKQNGLNSERAVAERETRQRTEAAQHFNNTVNTEYNTEIFAMADDFAKQIAPALTFADSDTQIGHARNILTRVQNALGFMIEENGFSADPMADFYAGQLKEEGIKFDFAKGRQLLQEHYVATRNLLAVKNTKGVTPDEIARAERKKNAALSNVKAEQRQLLGQITQKYVKSNANQLQRNTEEQLKNKQQVRVKPPARPGAVQSGKDSRDRVDTDIKDYNRRRAAEIASGDDLYDFHTA